MTRKALGRGLGALFPQETEAPAEGIQQVPLGQIHPSPWQLRRQIKEEELGELTASIRAQGVLQPILLRLVLGTPPGEGNYQLIAGERRWRAARLAGLSAIPAVVREVTDEEALEIALIENLQREDLDPLEEAEAYKKLMDTFGLTQEQVAQKVGKDRASVANSLRLLRLPDFIKAALSRRSLSLGHAKTLLAIEGLNDLMAVGKIALDKELSVRETALLVKNWHKQPRERELKTKKTAAPPSKFDRSPQIRNVEDQLRQRLGTQVRILKGHGKVGHVVIEFYSDEDLDRIYDLICGR